MATTSPNLNLRLPEGTDTVDVTLDLSNNYTKIDNTYSSETPSTFEGNAIADAGSSGRVAKADHEHGGPGFAVPVRVSSANSEGTALTLARSDHVHKSVQYLNHVETFWLDPAVPEDMYVQVPSAPATCVLILRGRVHVAGLLPAHTHTASDSTESATHTHSGTSASNGGETVTSAGGSSHSHSGSSSAAGSAHGHSLSISSTLHSHSLYANAGFDVGSAVDINVGGSGGFEANWIDGGPGGSHGHSGSTANNESAHTHTLTIAADTSHTHSVTTSNHTHTLTTGTESATHVHTVTVNSAGSGGTTSATYPQGVTVVIDGVDRTAALGGPFGAATGWNGAQLDILPYVSSVGEHYLIFGCTTGGKLKAQVLMSI